MAMFYVSVDRGSDATGDGSALNPWKTINHAIGPSPAAALDPSGPNTLYIEPGIYRESVALGVSPTAAGPLAIRGDYDGAGFAAGGRPAPATGLVDWRAWYDEVTPIPAQCFGAVGKSHVEVSRIKFTCGDTQAGVFGASGSSDWAFRDCVVVSGFKQSQGNGMTFNATAGEPLDLTVERCSFYTFYGDNGALLIFVPYHTADWPLNVRVVNCLFQGKNAALFMYQSGGSGGRLGGAVTFQSCTVVGSSNAGLLAYVGGGVPAAPLVGVYDSVFVGCYLQATSDGQTVEDGNVFMASAPNVNVPAGAHSVFGACHALDFGDDRITGLPPRPLGTPSPAGVFAGLGGRGTTPADDLTGRPRPEGFGLTAPSAGCLERHDTGVKDAAYQDVGSPACMALVGPSSQELSVLVDAVATTLSVKVRWDGGHGDAARPQAVLVAEPQIGVAGQVVTAVSTGGTGATPNAYETLAFAPFTPTGPGVVKLRLVSRSATGSGAAYFDTINLS